jgi:AraC-like DNA-binding protein
MQPPPTLRFVARVGAALGPVLAPHVRSIWASRGPAPTPEERVLPDGGGALIINLGPTLRTGQPGEDLPWRPGEALLSGALRTWASVRYPSGAAHEQVGALFWAGGLAALTPLAAGLAEQAAVGPIGRLGGGHGRLDGLAERLADLGDLDQRVDRMAQALAAALQANGARAERPLGAKLLALCEAAPTVDAAELVARGGWSAQHLNRQLRAEGGLSLKGLQRVARLQAALRALRTSAAVGEVGSTLQYADQAHFAHDLQALTGLRASALRALGPPAAGRVLSVPAEVQNLQGGPKRGA